MRLKNVIKAIVIYAAIFLCCGIYYAEMTDVIWTIISAGIFMEKPGTTLEQQRLFSRSDSRFFMVVFIECLHQLVWDFPSICNGCHLLPGLVHHRYHFDQVLYPRTKIRFPGSSLHVLLCSYWKTLSFCSSPR